MSVLSDAARAMTAKAVALAPDGGLPGGKPDPLIAQPSRLIGQPVSRLDGPAKVRGAASFAAEFPLDEMVDAAVAFSTIAKGRIASIDTAAAQAAPGVVLVMTHGNAPPMKPTPLFMSDPKAAGPDNIPVMQDDRIHWNGQAIAVVLAATQEQADHAKSLLEVNYAPEAAVTAYAAAKSLHTEVAVFQGEPLKVEKGDAEKSLAAAARKVARLYRTPLSHASLQP